MFCSKCGNQINDKAVICPKCGCPTQNYKETQIAQSFEQIYSSTPKQTKISHIEARERLEKAQKNSKISLLPMLLFFVALVALQFAVDDYYPLIVIPVICSAIITLIINVLSIQNIQPLSQIKDLVQRKNAMQNALALQCLLPVVYSIVIIMIAIVKSR